MMNVTALLAGLMVVGQVTSGGPAPPPSRTVPNGAVSGRDGLGPNVIAPEAAKKLLGGEKLAPGRFDDDFELQPRSLRQPANTKVQPEDYGEEMPLPSRPAVREAPPVRELPPPRDTTPIRPSMTEPVRPRTIAPLPNDRTNASDRTGADAPAREPAPRRGTNYSHLRDATGQPRSVGGDPLGSNPPAANASTVGRPDSRRSSELIAHALAAPSAGGLEGRPLALVDAVARRSDRDGRARLVHAYWKLTAATAAYYWSLDEYQRTLEVEPPRDREIPGVLGTARSTAKARMYESQLVAVNAQYELDELLRSNDAGGLPTPADPPYVGLYATRFESIYGDGRSASLRIRQIHQTLPLLYDAVQSRAQAIGAAAEALDAAQSAVKKGQGDLDLWLGRFRELSQQRQAFLAVVRAYNDDIADYALAVSQDGASAAELTSMLIRYKPTAPAPRTSQRDTLPFSTPQSAPRWDNGRTSPPRYTAPSTAAPPTTTRPTVRDGFVPRRTQ